MLRAAHHRLRIAPEEESDRTAVRAPGAGVQNSAVFCARSASAGVVTRYFSRCLIFWCFWIKPKYQKINRGENICFFMIPDKNRIENRRFSF